MQTLLTIKQLFKIKQSNENQLLKLFEYMHAVDQRRKAILKLDHLEFLKTVNVKFGYKVQGVDAEFKDLLKTLPKPVKIKEVEEEEEEVSLRADKVEIIPKINENKVSEDLLERKRPREEKKRKTLKEEQQQSKKQKKVQPNFRVRSDRFGRICFDRIYSIQRQHTPFGRDYLTNTYKMYRKMVETSNNVISFKRNAV